MTTTICSKRWRAVFACILAILLSVDALADVHVRGYYRKNGTYVAPHWRSSPNNTTLDNWSTKGNVNPYTLKEGTKNPKELELTSSRIVRRHRSKRRRHATGLFLPESSSEAVRSSVTSDNVPAAASGNSNLEQRRLFLVRGPQGQVSFTNRQPDPGSTSTELNPN